MFNSSENIRHKACNIGKSDLLNKELASEYVTVYALALRQVPCMNDLPNVMHFQY